ncbi:MAG: sulfate adenylyltransferase subunit CysN [Kiritimatiellia bacterium]
MNIQEYLSRHEAKDLLRFLTCGSVDDGKSTLIGRLLHDTKSIYEDQMAAVRKDSAVHGTTGDDFDPALLTDGLKAEREQGITIDVAYRYFSTDKRMFIIADTPGHEQYTRNMATGASTCNLAVVLVDARHGVITQTRRHSFIASLLGIRHVVIAVNKMDLMSWSEEVFDNIRKDYNEFVARLDFQDIHYIPMSALKGDNVVDQSANMPWYQGPPLLNHLENVNISTDRNLVDLRFPVQHVIRPHLDFRGFAGTVASGVMRVGDTVMSLPSRRTSRVKSIVTFEGERQEAYPPLAVTVTLEDEIDVSRGSMLVHPNNLPKVGNEWEAMLVWMHEKPAKAGQTYLVKQAANTAPATLEELRFTIDVNTMRRADSDELGMNDIGRARLTLHRPLAYDHYQRNRQTGNFILIDRMTNATVAAGMILDRVVSGEDGTKVPVSRNIRREASMVATEDREQILKQRGVTIWLTGLSGSGKSTIAKQLEQQLVQDGHLCYILDGDNIRHGLNRDLGFSAEERKENIRRIAEVAHLFNMAGMIAVTAFISPYRADREMAREIVGADNFLEVHVSTPIEVCEQRDPKSLYKKARAGEIPQFTGITDPYEAPGKPSLEIDASALEPEESVKAIIQLMRESDVFR